MSVLTIIKKVGEKILSIVEVPFKDAAKVEAILAAAIKDETILQPAIVGLVQQFESLGPDVLTAIAADGLNIPDDLKSAADVKSVFAYFTSIFLPAVEQAFDNLKSAAGTPEADPAPAAMASASASTVAALHTSVPA